jgi:hypothetical protein
MSDDLVTRLRNTPNWKREEYGNWKDATSVYDRAPFEAADEIERLRAERDALRALLAEARYHVSGVRVGGEWLTNRIEAALREGE